MQELPLREPTKHCSGRAHADFEKPFLCPVRERWELRLSHIRLITFTCRETHAQHLSVYLIHKWSVLIYTVYLYMCTVYMDISCYINVTHISRDNWQNWQSINEKQIAKCQNLKGNGFTEQSTATIQHSKFLKGLKDNLKSKVLRAKTKNWTVT